MKRVFPTYTRNKGLLVCPVVGVAVGSLLAPMLAKTLPAPEPSMGKEIQAPYLRHEAMTAGQMLSGHPSSSFALVEVSNYLCPGCRQAKTKLTNHLDGMRGVARVLVHFPFHQGARKASLASLEADRLGFGDAYHRALMRYPPTAWGEITSGILRGEGVTVAKLRSYEADASSRLSKNLEIVSHLEVRSTPTFFVCGNSGNVFQAWSESDAIRYLRKRGAQFSDQ